MGLPSVLCRQNKVVDRLCCVEVLVCFSFSSVRLNLNLDTEDTSRDALGATTGWCILCTGRFHGKRDAYLGFDSHMEYPLVGCVGCGEVNRMGRAGISSCSIYSLIDDATGIPVRTVFLQLLRDCDACVVWIVA